MVRLDLQIYRQDKNSSLIGEEVLIPLLKERLSRRAYLSDKFVELLKEGSVDIESLEFVFIKWLKGGIRSALKSIDVL